MRRLVALAAVVTLLAGLTSSAWAQMGEPGCGMCPMAGGMGQMHHGGTRGMGAVGEMHGILSRAEELALSKEQVDSIRDLGAKWAEQRVDLTAAVEKARIRLASLLRAREIDMQDVEKQLDAVFQAQKELQLGHIRHMAKVRKVLTDDQREKISTGLMGCAMMGRHNDADKDMKGPRGMHHGRGMGMCR